MLTDLLKAFDCLPHELQSWKKVFGMNYRNSVQLDRTRTFLISTFAYIFTVIAKVQFLEDSARGYVSSQIRSCNTFGKFITLDFNFRFTRDESELY